MRYNGVVQRKLALLSEQILNIQTMFVSVSYSEFEESWLNRSAAERALQVAVEIIIDVAERIIAVEGVGPAATASEAIEKLVKLGVLQSKDPYVDMVRFRNLIVHQYEKVSPEILYTLVTKNLQDFKNFIDEINRD
ncbi:MAG: DUF86 domain-containing protein [Kiritimatiellae bacterium]|jgi:uncharacterized protein YutE (UPF0331/DUF86 family)|nr:DUF86 domain-containing protein [Kiritimatiellia bacterium]